MSDLRKKQCKNCHYADWKSTGLYCKFNEEKYSLIQVRAMPYCAAQHQIDKNGT